MLRPRGADGRTARRSAESATSRVSIVAPAPGSWCSSLDRWAIDFRPRTSVSCTIPSLPPIRPFTFRPQSPLLAPDEISSRGERPISDLLADRSQSWSTRARNRRSRGALASNAPRVSAHFASARASHPSDELLVCRSVIDSHHPTGPSKAPSLSSRRYPSPLSHRSWRDDHVLARARVGNT